MKLLTKQGIIKSQTECAPNNGYFLIPLYDKVLTCDVIMSKFCYFSLFIGYTVNGLL